jgi:hypothetical protein
MQNTIFNDLYNKSQDFQIPVKQYPISMQSKIPDIINIIYPLLYIEFTVVFGTII